MDFLCLSALYLCHAKLKDTNLLNKATLVYVILLNFLHNILSTSGCWWPGTVWCQIFSSYSTNPRILMAECKTAVTPMLIHWSYCSIALSHGYIYVPIDKLLWSPLLWKLDNWVWAAVTATAADLDCMEARRGCMWCCLLVGWQSTSLVDLC